MKEIAFGFLFALEVTGVSMVITLIGIAAERIIKKRKGRKNGKRK